MYGQSFTVVAASLIVISGGKQRTMMIKEMAYELVGKLARLRLNYVIREGAIICKRRVWGGQWLIRGARLFGPTSFVVLPESKWLAWEPHMYRLFYGLEVRRFGRMLVLPVLPGVVLDHYWQTTSDPQVQLQAFAAAVVALYNLHQHVVHLPDGVMALYSHADATCYNVLYDPETNQANWFDFETMHPSHLGAVVRQAHDVQLFADSAAALLPVALFPPLAHALFTHYPNRQVQQIVLEELSRPRPTLLALAQTRLPPKRRTIWYESLWQVHAGIG